MRHAACAAGAHSRYTTMAAPPLPPFPPPSSRSPPFPRSLSNEACSLSRWCPLAVHDGAVPPAEAQLLVALSCVWGVQGWGEGGRGSGSLAAVHDGAITPTKAQLLEALGRGKAWGAVQKHGHQSWCLFHTCMEVLHIIMCSDLIQDFGRELCGRKQRHTFQTLDPVLRQSFHTQRGGAGARPTPTGPESQSPVDWSPSRSPSSLRGVPGLVRDLGSVGQACNQTTQRGVFVHPFLQTLMYHSSPYMKLGLYPPGRCMAASLVPKNPR